MKTAVPRGTVGSNPTPSAKKVSIRRGDREAEGARLLSECMLKGVPWVRIPPSPPKEYFLGFYGKAVIY